MLVRMAGRSYPQVDGGPSDVVLELGRAPNTPPFWVFLVIPVVETALFGWVVFFLPWPLYITLPVSLGVPLLLATAALSPRLMPPSALTTKGVRIGMGVTPWNEVLGYSFVEPAGLSLVVVGHTLNVLEDVAFVYCPPELREQALAVFRQYAPKAKLLGRVPGRQP